MVKILTHAMPAEQIVFARFFVGLLVILFFIVIKFARLTFHNKRLLIFRGVIGSLAILFYFKSASLIPISETIVLQFTYPIFATIFAAFFLGEELKKRALVAMFVAFLGILFITSPVFEHFSYGYLWGIISAMFAGGAITATRKLRRKESSWSITLSLMSCGSVLGFFLSADKFVMPESSTLILIVLMAVIATAAQILLNYSYKICSVAEGTTISMVTVPVTILLAVLFLKEEISSLFVFGAILIIGSILYLMNFGRSDYLNNK